MRLLFLFTIMLISTAALAQLPPSVNNATIPPPPKEPVNQLNAKESIVDPNPQMRRGQIQGRIADHPKTLQDYRAHPVQP